MVQIDESKFGKRKYNRGRRRGGQWVWGGVHVERGSDEVFMQIAPSRDAATLLPVIIANVKPGTEIYTDEWRSYSRLNRRGYTYTTRLIIPYNLSIWCTHTQSIECTCYMQRKSTRKCTALQKHSFPHTYSAWNLYGEEKLQKTHHAFAMFMNCITVVYPL